MKKHKVLKDRKAYLLKVINYFSPFKKKKQKKMHQKLCLFHLSRKIEGVLSSTQIQIVIQVIADCIRSDFLFPRIVAVGYNTLLFNRCRKGYKTNKPFMLEVTYCPKKNVYLSNIKDNVTGEIIGSDISTFPYYYDYILYMMKEREKAKKSFKHHLASEQWHRLHPTYQYVPSFKL